MSGRVSGPSSGEGGHEDPSPLVAPRRRILVVDDDPVIQTLVSAVLEKAGHEVVLADDGAGAVAAAARDAFDLILIDLNMPVMDGAEAAGHIRAAEGTRRHVPIVALTATADQGERDRCLALGVDAFLTKPFNRDGLLGAVERFAGVAPSGR